MIGSCRVINSRMIAGRRRMNGPGSISAGFSCLGLKKSVWRSIRRRAAIMSSVGMMLGLLGFQMPSKNVFVDNDLFWKGYLKDESCTSMSLSVIRWLAEGWSRGERLGTCYNSVHNEQFGSETKSTNHKNWWFRRVYLWISQVRMQLRTFS